MECQSMTIQQVPSQVSASLEEAPFILYARRALAVSVTLRNRQLKSLPDTAIFFLKVVWCFMKGLLMSELLNFWKLFLVNRAKVWGTFRRYQSSDNQRMYMKHCMASLWRATVPEACHLPTTTVCLDNSQPYSADTLPNQATVATAAAHEGSSQELLAHTGAFFVIPSANG